jgi:hypothetical protein
VVLVQSTRRGTAHGEKHRVSWPCRVRTFPRLFSAQRYVGSQTRKCLIDGDISPCHGALDFALLPITPQVSRVRRPMRGACIILRVEIGAKGRNTIVVRSR